MPISLYNLNRDAIRSCPNCGKSRVPDTVVDNQNQISVRKTHPAVTIGNGIGSQKTILFNGKWCNALTGYCSNCHQDVLIFYDEESNKCYISTWNEPCIQEIKRELWNDGESCPLCDWEALINRVDNIDFKK